MDGSSVQVSAGAGACHSLSVSVGERLKHGMCEQRDILSVSYVRLWGRAIAKTSCCGPSHCMPASPGVQELSCEVLGGVLERGALREALLLEQGEQAVLRHELGTQVGTACVGVWAWGLSV